MNIQEIIVGILVATSIIGLVRRIVQYVKRISRNQSPCGGCGCAGCPSSGTCSGEKK